MAKSSHSFDYDGFDGPSTTSSDPYAQLGLALRYFTPFKAYAELGVDCSCIFLLKHYVLGLTPRLCVGYKLY